MPEMVSASAEARKDLGKRITGDKAGQFIAPTSPAPPVAYVAPRLPAQDLTPAQSVQAKADAARVEITQAKQATSEIAQLGIPDQSEIDPRLASITRQLAAQAEASESRADYQRYEQHFGKTYGMGPEELTRRIDRAEAGGLFAKQEKEIAEADRAVSEYELALMQYDAIPDYEKVTGGRSAGGELMRGSIRIEEQAGPILGPGLAATSAIGARIVGTVEETFRLPGRLLGFDKTEAAPTIVSPFLGPAPVESGILPERRMITALAAGVIFFPLEAKALNPVTAPITRIASKPFGFVARKSAGAFARVTPPRIRGLFSQASKTVRARRGVTIGNVTVDIDESVAGQVTFKASGKATLKPSGPVIRVPKTQIIQKFEKAGGSIVSPRVSRAIERVTGRIGRRGRVTAGRLATEQDELAFLMSPREAGAFIESKGVSTLAQRGRELGELTAQYPTKAPAGSVPIGTTARAFNVKISKGIWRGYRGEANIAQITTLPADEGQKLAAYLRGLSTAQRPNLTGLSLDVRGSLLPHGTTLQKAAKIGSFPDLFPSNVFIPVERAPSIIGAGIAGGLAIAPALTSRPRQKQPSRIDAGTFRDTRFSPINIIGLGSSVQPSQAPALSFKPLQIQRARMDKPAPTTTPPNFFKFNPTSTSPVPRLPNFEGIKRKSSKKDPRYKEIWKRGAKYTEIGNPLEILTGKKAKRKTYRVTPLQKFIGGKKR